MGFKELIVGIVLVGLFALCLITFTYRSQIDNNVEHTIMEDPSIQGLNDSLNDYLGEIESTAQTQREVFEQQEAQGGSTDEGFSLTSIVGIVKSFLSTAILLFNFIFVILFYILGIPITILNVLLGDLIIVALILLWRLIKAGGT